MKQKKNLCITISNDLSNIYKKRSVNKQAIAKLRIKFGLTFYEAISYDYLLKVDSASARQISNKTKIHMGCMYTTLNNLVKKRIIKSNNHRPKIYSIVYLKT